ncbi:MAG: ParA family protein [Legionella sp.]|uniref:ParA family protein n=1 Tax=Legionella sp. TaxID=459 RepID=UPI0039E42C4D
MIKNENKAKILVIANNKGGVGKTALTQLLISYAVTVLGLRVLAVDGDGQANLSKRIVKDDRIELPAKYFPPIHPEYNSQLHPNWDGVSSLASLYIKDQPIAVYPSYEYENLKVIPAHNEILKKIEEMQFDSTLSYEDLYDIPRKFFEPERMMKVGFDLVVADCAPAISITSVGLMRAATHTVMPFQLQEKSCEGLNAMLHCFHEQNEKKTRSQASKLIGFLVNQKAWNKRTGQDEQRQKLEESHYIKPYLIPCELRDSGDMAKVDTKGADLSMPFKGLKRNSTLRIDAINACNYIFSKMGYDHLIKEKGILAEENFELMEEV